MDLIKELNRIKIDKHRCLGCGYEHNCSVSGCAIINQAIDDIINLKEVIKKIDMDCLYCVNADDIPEDCKDYNFDCFHCHAECKCKDCFDNSQYEI